MIHIELNWGELLNTLAILALIYTLSLTWYLWDILTGVSVLRLVKLKRPGSLWLFPRLDSCIYVWNLRWVQLIWYTRRRSA